MEEQISSVAEDVWSSMLGQPLAAAQPSSLGSLGEGVVTGSVAIDGAWRGTVVVQCSTSLARRAASVMFDVALESVGRDEWRDAMGEIANMVGGNVKALLPAPSILALPSVREGRESAVPAPPDVETQVWLESGEGPVVVSLVVARPSLAEPRRDD